MVSSTGTFVSCKDYDDDIDAINKELTDLKSKLSDLESKVNAGGAYVTKIESVDGGFKVSVSDGTSYNLTVASAAPGSKVVIDDKTGEISIDGKATGWFATTGEGEEAVDMTPYVKDGYWYLYDKTEKEFVKSEYKAAGDAYAVVKDGVVTLHMPDESGKMQSIVLPLTANALTAISLPAGLTIGNTVATDAADDAVEISSAKAAKLDWKGPKGAIEKDQFLVGQIGVADLVVSPKNYDLSAQKLTLVDSKGNVAPVKVIATPNTFNSVIVGSRAASENGNWNLTVEMTDEVTADNINKVFKGTGANAGKEILYALCVNGIPYTAYDIAIKTKAPETSVAAITFAADKLSYIDAEGTEVKGATNAIELPVGTTTLKYADAKLYDSYITFEGTYLGDGRNTKETPTEITFSKLHDMFLVAKLPFSSYKEGSDEQSLGLLYGLLRSITSYSNVSTYAPMRALPETSASANALYKKIGVSVVIEANKNTTYDLICRVGNTIKISTLSSTSGSYSTLSDSNTRYFVFGVDWNINILQPSLDTATNVASE